MFDSKIASDDDWEEQRCQDPWIGCFCSSPRTANFVFVSNFVGRVGWLSASAKRSKLDAHLIVLAYRHRFLCLFRYSKHESKGCFERSFAMEQKAIRIAQGPWSLQAFHIQVGRPQFGLSKRSHKIASDLQDCEHNKSFSLRIEVIELAGASYHWNSDSKPW